MVKCPFCQFENEDGALFCEQCKSDLGSVPQAPPPVPPPLPEPVPMAAIVEESVPMAAVVDAPQPPPVPEFAAPPLPETPPAPPPAPAMEAAPPPPPVPAMEAAPPPPPVEAPPPPPVVAAAPAPPPAPVAPPPAPVSAAPLAADAKPHLVVLRGQKINQEFPIYEGHNFIGRADEKPVDIDLEDQEPPEKVWTSRQHAMINFDNGTLTIEDLNSANGTYVNRAKIHPGQPRQLNVNDVIQIGTVHLKVKA
jgi:pSer/pThr/pTyr-binding forkhead associated (FHA) protein